jgi:hypothetical protein
MTNGTKWQLSGDYFENCNCDVVCPCLVSRSPPLTAKPSQGECDVAIAFHIDRGSYGQVSLNGLNVVVAVHTPGPMADGNWSLGAYIDERATDDQTAALGAIFGGGEGGPMAAFAPLVATDLGMKRVPIRYAVSGKVRSVEIPGIMNMWSSLCRQYIRVGRFGARWDIRLRQIDLLLRLVGREAPSLTMGCGGTTLARTATTRRSTGRTRFSPTAASDRP